MTDKETLQKLFDAALRELPPVTSGPPKRAFPTTNPPQGATVPTASPFSKPAPAVSDEMVSPEPVAAPTPMPEPAAAAPEVPALDRTAADELGTLLDEKIRNTARKRLRGTVLTTIVLLGVTGGSVGWFVQSPARIQALTSAIQEIRSVGDVKSMVAKYQAALDKIAVRSGQLDQATAAMGVTASAEDEKDPYMESEMKEMMGGEGKTVGARNQALQASFGDRAAQADGLPKVAAAISREDSFDFSD